MKKITPIIMICLLILAMAGCASSENSIISMSLSGATLVEDSLIIDEAARTITATVEPVDISKVIPTFELSTKATIGDLSLEDGEACSCTVAAEDGTVSEWTVTVTVQPGISFKYDETLKTFTEGFIDSDDSDASNDYGNGLPVISWDEQAQADFIIALEEEKDLASDEVYTSEALVVVAYDSGNTAVLYYPSYGSDSYMSGIALMTTTQSGAVGDWETGTFSALVSENEDENSSEKSVNITDGFFKTLRLENEVSVLSL